MTNWWYLTREDAEVDGFAHLEIADRRGMNVVAAIERLDHQVGFRRIAHDRVEIEHRIEARILADPRVDLSFHLVLRLAPMIGVVRNDRGADDLEVFRLDARDDVFRARDYIGRGHVAVDVVGAHEQNDVRDARAREYVAVETFDARRRREGGIRAFARDR